VEGKWVVGTGSGSGSGGICTLQACVVHPLGHNWRQT